MIMCRFNGADSLEMIQQAVPPMVYLDHWALRKFSQDKALADRLTTILKSQDGTLALSWLNVAKFMKVTVEEQGRLAEELIGDILPHVFLLEIQPFEVIGREDQLLAGGPHVAPYSRGCETREKQSQQPDWPHRFHF
jgi:hypothetical protein